MQLAQIQIANMMQDEQEKANRVIAELKLTHAQQIDQLKRYSYIVPVVQCGAGRGGAERNGTGRCRKREVM